VTAVLLIAHGSRRREANDDLAKLAELVRARAEYPIVEIGYLELAEPTIPQGAEFCVHSGATRVLMLPFFLSAGEHVRGDLERLRQEFTDRFPRVRFELCEPLGLHPALVDVVLERLTKPRASRA
jgi:sirohydrochlorin ferrochelatase